MIESVVIFDGAEGAVAPGGVRGSAAWEVSGQAASRQAPRPGPEAGPEHGGGGWRRSRRERALEASSGRSGACLCAARPLDDA